MKTDPSGKIANKNESNIPFVKAHSEFYDYIESFPNQVHHPNGPNDFSQKEILLDHLRKELIQLAVNPKQIQDRLCYRNCFKWREKSYVEFCLNKKCNQNDFFEAARVLNYLK